MYDVVALGELLIDFASQGVDASGYPTMAANPGGAPANFLAALTEADLRFIGTYAVTAASLSTEALGGIPSIPAPETVLQRI